MSLYTFVIFIAGFLGGLVSTRSLPKAATIDLSYNRYQGVTLRNGVEQYLGMRYAKAPVHDLRFRAPEDPEHNNKLLNASSVSTSASINGEIG
jgi:acetylcholinesterase